jgi:hypothetical protein
MHDAAKSLQQAHNRTVHTVYMKGKPLAASECRFRQDHAAKEALRGAKEQEALRGAKEQEALRGAKEQEALRGAKEQEALRVAKEQKNGQT